MKFNLYWSWFLCLVSIGLGFTFLASHIGRPSPFFQMVTEEGGLWETIQWLALLLAALILLWLSYVRRRPFLLLLALAFFLCAGEELDFGQHYIGFETPSPLKGISQEGECNIHDSLGCIHLILQLMALIFLVLLPMMAKYWVNMRYIFKRIPLPPVAFVPFAILGLLIGWMPVGRWSVSEMQETLFYLVALGGIIDFARRCKRELQ